MKNRYLSSLLTTAALALGMTLVVEVPAVASDPIFSVSVDTFNFNLGNIG